MSVHGTRNENTEQEEFVNYFQTNYRVCFTSPLTVGFLLFVLSSWSRVWEKFGEMNTYSFSLWKNFSEKHVKFLKMKTSIRNLYFNKLDRNPKSPIRGQNPRTRKECKTRFTCQTVIMKRGKVFLARSIEKGSLPHTFLCTRPETCVGLAASVNRDDAEASKDVSNCALSCATAADFTPSFLCLLHTD